MDVNVGADRDAADAGLGGQPGARGERAVATITSMPAARAAATAAPAGGDAYGPNAACRRGRSRSGREHGAWLAEERLGDVEQRRVDAAHLATCPRAERQSRRPAQGGDLAEPPGRGEVDGRNPNRVASTRSNAVRSRCAEVPATVTRFEPGQPLEPEPKR
jgi:hypothetical protein